jgi:hypothetical protein
MTQTDHRIKTARSAGAVGRNAIVPRVAIEIAKQMKEELPSFSGFPRSGKGEKAGKDERFWFGILDFGCGPKFHHRDAYLDAGVNCYGYDIAFGSEHDDRPDKPGLAIAWSTVQAYAAGYGFNLVAASNVINVQREQEELFDTCQRLRIAAGWDAGYLARPEHKAQRWVAPILLNYPQEPRKLGWKAKKMRAYLEDVAFGVKAEVLRPGVWLFNPPERLVKR